MKTPAAVIWGCTKNFSAYKVQPKGARSRKECFNSSPMNLTGLHNQSACSSQFGLVSTKEESKKKKGTRTVFVLKQAHKDRHGGSSSKVLSNKWKSAKLVYSDVSMKRGAKPASKTIKGLTFANDKKKALLLKRLGKLAAASKTVKA